MGSSTNYLLKKTVWTTAKMMLIPLLATLFLVVSGHHGWEDHRLEHNLHRDPRAHEEEALSHLERPHPPRWHKGGRRGNRLKPLSDEVMPLDWDPEEPADMPFHMQKDASEEAERLHKEWREKRRGPKKGKGKKEKKGKGEEGKGRRPPPPVEAEEPEDNLMQE
ncbi:uncharacterized protein LOC144584321 isoform X2 [Pogona vitticeps]